MSAQSSINSVIGSITGGISGAVNAGSKASSAISTDSNTYAKMAEKARSTVKQKQSIIATNRKMAAERRAKLNMNADNSIGGDK